ncbi:hypothetical protein B0F90DRAFT_958200 [Multifurca ochricompacta]|uniref:Uncharacterized protein n=1 Tax=Multifurca ochricompacta TaxID=376703 RepID=A0AAD4QR64_9AGAM|nr:hypothetical protein B0F90DRAFT_958200 [Multifurca ochricompacta]
MGSATSSIPAEPVVAAVAVISALGYGYVHYARPFLQSDGGEADAGTGPSKATASVLHGQKKRGRKLQLPGDATLKNLDVLDASGSLSLLPAPIPASAPATRQQQQPRPRAMQSQEVVPGGFDGVVTSDDSREAQQHFVAAATKKPKKKKGKKVAVAVLTEPSSASTSPATVFPSALASTEGLAGNVAAPAPSGKPKKVQASGSATALDAQDERWTRVEARKKRAVSPHDSLSKLQTSGAMTVDVTTSDAGVTTSATGNSSPVTERTTEDELPSGLDESALGVPALSLLDAPPRVLPVRPLPGEQPAKGFTWEDYEGVQIDEDASGEDDGGWGVVRSRRRPQKTASGDQTTTAPQSQTKKQRQKHKTRRLEGSKTGKGGAATSCFGIT